MMFQRLFRSTRSLLKVSSIASRVMLVLTILSCSKIKETISDSLLKKQLAVFEGKSFVSEQEGQQFIITFNHGNSGIISKPTKFFMMTVFETSYIAWHSNGNLLNIETLLNDGSVDSTSAKQYTFNLQKDSTLTLDNQEKHITLRKIITLRPPLPNSVISNTNSSYGPRLINNAFVSVSTESIPINDDGTYVLFGSAARQLSTAANKVIFSFDENNHGTTHGSLLNIPLGSTNISLVSLPKEYFWEARDDSLIIQESTPEKLGDVRRYKIEKLDDDSLIITQKGKQEISLIKMIKQSN